MRFVRDGAYRDNVINRPFEQRQRVVLDRLLKLKSGGLSEVSGNTAHVKFCLEDAEGFEARVAQVEQEIQYEGDSQ